MIAVRIIGCIIALAGTGILCCLWYNYGIPQNAEEWAAAIGITALFLISITVGIYLSTL